MSPCVSVILPVLKLDEFLHPAIQSLKEQTLDNFECFICYSGKNGSALNRLLAGDSRFRVLPLEDMPLAAALAHGVEMARAPFVARMDADDISLPGRLEAQYRELARQPDTALLGCGWQVIDRGGAALRIKQPAAIPPLPQALLWGCPFLHPGVMIRKEMLLRAGNYRAFFRYAEDYDLWFRLSHFGKLKNLHEILMRYRLHGKNKSVANAIAARRYSMMAQALFLLGSASPSPGEWDFENIMRALPLRERANVTLRMLACSAPHTGDAEEDPEGWEWLAKYSRIASPDVARKARRLWRLHCAKRYFRSERFRSIKHIAAAFAGE